MTSKKPHSSTKYEAQVNPLYDYAKLEPSKRPKVRVPRRGMKRIDKSN